MITIPLTRGYVAVVDDEDAHLAALKWSVTHKTRGAPNIYAHRYIQDCDGKETHERLHRVIMLAPDGVWVDHIDGDGLNCRRSNLRLVTAWQNAINRRPQAGSASGFKGASIDKGGRWRAGIQVRGKRLGLGCFASPEEAARAYDAAAREHYGEFAWVNFPSAPGGDDHE
jgi:hypothetical protein